MIGIDLKCTNVTWTNTYLQTHLIDLNALMFYYDHIKHKTLTYEIV